jgi:hypothetical protein
VNPCGSCSPFILRNEFVNEIYPQVNAPSERPLVGVAETFPVLSLCSTGRSPGSEAKG